MAAYYPYVLVEREVYGLLNALHSDDAADAQAKIAFAGQLDGTQVDDAAYPMFLVRRVILTVQNLIGTAIINTVGHARRVDFAVTGPLVWRGGFNAARLDSTNNLWLDTECGINRVAIRSTLKSGTITVTATRAGLAPATLQIEAHPVEITVGLSSVLPVTLSLR